MTEYDHQEKHNRSNKRNLPGGGKVEYLVSHRDEEQAQRLSGRIETAIEMHKARWFGEEPRQRLARSTNSEHKHGAIRAAVTQANQNPSLAKHVDGELEYVVEDAYYPDDYSHYIVATNIAPEDRARAFLHAQSELCQRGYGINSIRADDDGHLTKFHVVSLTWFYSSRSYGRQKFESEGRNGE